MKRFGWRSSAGEDDQSSPPDANSPARSQRSSNSSRAGSLKSSSNTATKSREQSPAGLQDRDATGAAGGGAAAVAVSNKKTLKIGANVRFRGDVMECNTVVLCGRLQVM